MITLFLLFCAPIMRNWLFTWVILSQTNTLIPTFGTLPSWIVMLFGMYVVCWLKTPNPKYFLDRTIGLDFTGSSTFGVNPKYCTFCHHLNISNVRNFWTNKYIQMELTAMDSGFIQEYFKISFNFLVWFWTYLTFDPNFWPWLCQQVREFRPTIFSTKN